MSGQTYQPGERVDFTVRGALVVACLPAEDLLWVTYESLDGEANEVRLDMGLTGRIEVARVAPPEWPPRPGELWVDRFGVRHFATGPGPLASFLIGASGVQMDPARVLAAYGPLALESGRDDPTPTSGAVSGAVSTSDERLDRTLPGWDDTSVMPQISHVTGDPPLLIDPPAVRDPALDETQIFPRIEDERPW